MKSILILSQTDLFSDNRINRTIRLLQPDYNVIATGIKHPYVPGVRFIRGTHAPMNLKGKVTAFLHLVTRQYEAYYWRRNILHDLREKTSDIVPDLVLSCDIEMLPLGLTIAREKGAKVVCDIPDYPPQRIAKTPNEAVLYPSVYWEHLCRSYLPHTDAVITSSQGMAQLYERDLGISPYVLPNAPDYAPVDPQRRAEDESHIRLVFRGEALPFYRYDYEALLDLFGMLDARFELHMLLSARGKRNRQYRQVLRSRLEKMERAHFFPTPDTQLLFPSAQSFAFDIGLYMLKPRNEHQRFMLPEVVFEFIQARLALAIGPSQEMAAIVREHDCGVVADDFSPRAMARALMQLDHARINHYKQQSHAIAEAMSSRATGPTLLRLVENLLRGEGRGEQGG